jgi:hypothetical protein
MEYGPRALGFRSILADPGRARIADYVNACVKGRERFRPFAPAVPLEVADRYFEVLAPSPFMLLKYRVRPEYRDRLAGVTHVDGSARAQTVTPEENVLFHRLLHRFGERSGAAVLLNTSFNLAGEPLVETPEQAVASAKRGGLDALVLNDFFVPLRERPGIMSFAGLPALPEGVIHEPTAASPPQVGEPRRFEIGPSWIETWLSNSIERRSAARFFASFYRRPFLAALDALAAAGNRLDRWTIRELP